MSAPEVKAAFGIAPCEVTEVPIAVIDGRKCLRTSFVRRTIKTQPKNES